MAKRNGGAVVEVESQDEHAKEDDEEREKLADLKEEQTPNNRVVVSRSDFATDVVKGKPAAELNKYKKDSVRQRKPKSKKKA
jgi:hypothetical protein